MKGFAVKSLAGMIGFDMSFLLLKDYLGQTLDGDGSAFLMTAKAQQYQHHEPRNIRRTIRHPRSIILPRLCHPWHRRAHYAHRGLLHIPAN